MLTPNGGEQERHGRTPRAGPMGGNSQPGVALHVRETAGGKCLSHIRYVGLTLSGDLFVHAKDLLDEAMVVGCRRGLARV
jgi:hypothetical protein